MSAITIRLRYFAALREALGTESGTLTLSAGATIADARAALGEHSPTAHTILTRCVAARNRAFADDATVLTDGDEVVFIPPMAGGAAYASSGAL